jgi:asparagine synthase (glutamine-hydrolysing)
MKADKMSSAFGLEERVPYMDHRLVEFGLNLPIKSKLNVWNEKLILKNTFRKFLPKKIVKRRKRGYNVPIDNWFKNLLESKIIETFDVNNHKLYNKQFLIELLAKLKKLGNNYKRNWYVAQQLWTIYIFEEWYNLNFVK